MSVFEDIHAARVRGSLAMFDRVIFRGHLRNFYKPGSVRVFLWEQGVPLTGFGQWAKTATDAICDNAHAIASAPGRPVIYLERNLTRDTGQTKEDLVRKIAERDGMVDGLVCVLRTLEPCLSFDIRRNHFTHQLEAVPRTRKCVHFYFYYIDAEFGFMHIKIQTWLPWPVQVYVNGREWLARQLDAAGVGYLRYTNTLLRIEDLQAAADLCERFAHRAWPRTLDALARRVNPHLATVRRAGFGGYYWVLDQAEIATDVMFHTRATLGEIMPDLVRHASLNMSSADVLRFLGRKLHPSLKAEVITDTKSRPEGWRVKHRVARNWIKVYDKVSVLRVETTINNLREFRVLRVFTDERGRRERRWTEMNKGVANMWRYYQVGMAANRRYLGAPAAAPLKGKGIAALDALCRPPNPARTSPRPLRPPPTSRPPTLPRPPGRRPQHRRIQKRRPRRPPLPPTSPRPQRSPPSLRPHLPPDRQTPRPRPGGQGPPPAPVPCHPLRTACPHRRPRPPRPALPRRLPRCGLKPSTATRKSWTVIQ
jgi:hypothetical protein